MVTVAIVDYGVGNLHSIRRGIELAGAKVLIAREPAEIAAVDGIVLPGVGAFRSAMQKLANNLDALNQAISAGKPLLGICLGMQMLLTWSEEGGHTRGLDLISGRVVKLPHGLKVPHMGWNSIEVKKEHPFVAGVQSGSHVYFVHSYYSLSPEDAVLATSSYGVEFPAIIARKSVIGTQFHPEKSSRVGLQMLHNFIQMVKSA